MTSLIRLCTINSNKSEINYGGVHIGEIFKKTLVPHINLKKARMHRFNDQHGIATHATHFKTSIRLDNQSISVDHIQE